MQWEPNGEWQLLLTGAVSRMRVGQALTVGVMWAGVGIAAGSVRGRVPQSGRATCDIQCTSKLLAP